MMMMMMMIAPNSFARQKEGVQMEGEEEAGYQKKGGQSGGRSHRSISVRGVKCEE